MVRNFESTAGVSKKLIPTFKGPYEICKKLQNDRYVVNDIEGYQITQKYWHMGSGKLKTIYDFSPINDSLYKQYSR